ncbi:hypothetical protein I4F81_004840 [Pyropia yezoensis]|uniref:Uncharacterized protein n=1 Tax=Pyropia yezoensis TaxID=2788 RepID=A0ACC3BXQ7_PYRYE|nr:hypothetical protein I4F81_004840 [Neopyropia yezoensis]
MVDGMASIPRRSVRSCQSTCTCSSRQMLSGFTTANRGHSSSRWAKSHRSRWQPYLLKTHPRRGRAGRMHWTTTQVRTLSPTARSTTRTIPQQSSPPSLRSRMYEYHGLPRKLSAPRMCCGTPRARHLNLARTMIVLAAISDWDGSTPWAIASDDRPGRAETEASVIRIPRLKMRSRCASSSPSSGTGPPNPVPPTLASRSARRSSRSRLCSTSAWVSSDLSICRSKVGPCLLVRLNICFTELSRNSFSLVSPSQRLPRFWSSWER